MQILLVDDDVEIRVAFTAALTRRGHQVTSAGTVETALMQAQVATPDVAVVDIMLPDGDGFGLCREIRSRWGFPTVMLTARDDEVDIVGGLEAGADDYVVKPVSPAVLEARLRAVLRRSTPRGPAGPGTGAGVLVLGDLTVDRDAVEVTGPGGPVALSATEYRLLVELAEHHGQAFSRDQLVDRVWSESPPSTARVVDTTVQRVRAKLAEAGVTSPQLETLRGIGYRLR